MKPSPYPEVIRSTEPPALIVPTPVGFEAINLLDFALNMHSYSFSLFNTPYDHITHQINSNKKDMNEIEVTNKTNNEKGHRCEPFDLFAVHFKASM